MGTIAFILCILDYIIFYLHYKKYGRNNLMSKYAQATNFALPMLVLFKAVYHKSDIALKVNYELFYHLLLTSFILLIISSIVLLAGIKKIPYKTQKAFAITRMAIIIVYILLWV